ncbi:MAG: TIGR01620 family protein [Pseudomonadota bacterium]
MNDAPKRRGPTLIEDGLADLPPAPASPAEAPPVDPPEAPATAVAARIAAGGGRGPGALAKLFWGALLSLLLMAVGLWFWETVESLLARNLWLGRIALALAGIAALTLAVLILREVASLSRLGKIEDLRETAEAARAARDRGGAAEVVSGLDRLYRGRAELTDARADLTARGADVLDADALINAAERALLAPLDEAAEREVSRAARNVAAATAFIPLALVDVLTALYVNLSMIRRIAEIYGGRAGWLGSWRLLKAVATHLVAAGAMAVGDDLIGPALGGGAVAKLSRRFGEGLVNGALTARIGVAAIEVCRPLPFAARARPNVAALVKNALRSIVN